MSCEIPLTRGMVAVVDDEDYELVGQLKWCARRSGNTYYATRGTRTEAMHRVIAGATDGVLVDHIDGNGLNNRRSNLRLVTQAQNARNQTRKRAGSSSRFKGVYWHKSTQKWAAQIRVNSKQRFIGTFASEEAARDAYAQASVELHGEFGCPYAEAAE